MEVLGSKFAAEGLMGVMPCIELAKGALLAGLFRILPVLATTFVGFAADMGGSLNGDAPIGAFRGVSCKSDLLKAGVLA